jgi:peptidoglycan hydrolase-like protein with peptidoglycan-binding domain
MKLKTAFLVLLGSIALARADDTIAKAQQALKDQGFYYGEVTGEKNTDTTAAIRRYQIRNGLPVTGELDGDTVQSLGNNKSAGAEPAAKAAPSPSPNAPQEADREIESEPQTPLQPFDNNAWGRRIVPRHVDPNEPSDRQSYPSNPGPVVPPGGGLFSGTPYESAPPEVQRDVIASTQRILAGRDLYRGDIDGIFGPGTEFSLRAYQARVHLPVTGRLDLETLAGLELLPGAHRPVFTPRWRRVRPYPEPPVRGEWVRP